MNSKYQKLREEAIKQIQTHGTDPALQNIDLKSLVEELSIYQFELEAQNQELLNSQVELESIKSRYRELFDLAPVGYVLLNSDLIITEANYTFAKYINTSPKVLVGNRLTRFIIADFQDKFYHYLQEVSESNEGLESEFIFQLSDSTKIYLSVLGTCTKGIQAQVNEYRLAFTDITEKKNLSKRLELKSLKLAESEVKFRQIVEQSSDIFFYQDLRTYEFLYISPRLYEILGYTENEVLKMTFDDQISLIHPENQQGFKRLIYDTLSQYNQGKSQLARRFRIKNRNGEYRWLSGFFTIISNKEGKPLKLLGSLHDITQLKETETELIIARDKALESDRLKSAFLANISHEIRTPMNGILGFAGLLKAPDTLPEEQSAFIDIIEKSGLRLLNLINELINISKIEAGQFELIPNPVNIKQLLNELYQFFSLEAKQKGLILREAFLSINDEFELITDKDKIYEVMVNLIKNAIKYTDKGFIEFGAEKRINEVYFYVADSGVGIPIEKQELIFERFRQVEETNFTQGAGLGLSIAKGFVEIMGGKLKFSSEPGKGSTFYFSLPLH